MLFGVEPPCLAASSNCHGKAGLSRRSSDTGCEGKGTVGQGGSWVTGSPRPEGPIRQQEGLCGGRWETQEGQVLGLTATGCPTYLDKLLLSMGSHPRVTRKGSYMAPQLLPWTNGNGCSFCLTPGGGGRALSVVHPTTSCPWASLSYPLSLFLWGCHLSHLFIRFLNKKGRTLTTADSCCVASRRRRSPIYGRPPSPTPSSSEASPGWSQIGARNPETGACVLCRPTVVSPCAWAFRLLPGLEESVRIAQQSRGKG